MSEPRKLHTNGASGRQGAAGSGLSDQDQYEAARRRAQQMANQNAQRRGLQQPVRMAQGRTIRQTPPPQAVQEPEPMPAEELTPPVQEPEAPRELTHAQKQAMAYRAAAERKYGNTVRFPAQRRTVNTASRQQVQRTVRQSAAPRQAPRPEEKPPVAGGIRMEEDLTSRRAPADAPQEKSTYRASKNGGKAGGGNGGKPPRDGGVPPAGKSGKGKKGGDGAGPYTGKGKKKKKKGLWWKILLVTFLIILMIFGGAYAFIMASIAPPSGITLSELINTPKEFQGKELNILVTGVDRSSTGNLSAGAANDSNVNDGMTDMILYVHFNNETGELKMLQIPRDTIVSTDRSVASNYRINSVAKTQGSDNNNNMAALCELVADQLQVPIDGYMTIRLEMLTELVDLFGGVEINVPFDVDYAAIGEGDSVIRAGYQTLNGEAMEFLLRARKIYPDGDIGRLNMQRQFYAALFRKLKSIGNIWDVARLAPAVLNYMETDLSASQLVSFAVSLLHVDSSKIMICQMPVKMGAKYNDESVVYPARQEDADLLNENFRENTGHVDASELNLCDDPSVLGFDISGLTATDPNIQVMGGLMEEADDAQHNNNLDGSNQVVDVTESESTSASPDSSSGDSSSDSAA